MCSPPLVTLAAQNFHVQHVEAHQRPSTLGENVRHVEEVIGVNRGLAGWLATHHALFMISFHAGNFEESMQAFYLLLTGAFLGQWGVASQAFFFLDSLLALRGL